MPALVRATLNFDRDVACHDALMVAQALRRAALSIYGPEAPPALSGHDTQGPARGHAHPYWLPWDADGDGALDHCLVILHDPTLITTITAVDHLMGPVPATVQWESAAPALARDWVSVTPWVPLRFPHAHPGAAYMEQLQAECTEHGLPGPTVIEARPVQGWRTRPGWPHSHLFWHLRFPVPVWGPFALGRGAHAGLGLFQALEDGGGA